MRHLLPVILCLFLFSPAMAATPVDKLVTSDDWKDFQGGCKAAEKSMKKGKEQLEKIRENWKQMEEFIPGNETIPADIRDQFAQLQKNGMGGWLEQGEEAMKGLEEGLKKFDKTALGQAKKALDFHEKFGPKQNDAFHALNQLKNLTGTMDDLIKKMQDFDKTGMFKKASYPISKIIEYYRKSIEAFDKKLRKLDKTIKKRNQYAIGEGVPNTDEKAKKFAGKFPGAIGFPFPKIKYPGKEFWTDSDGRGYLWDGKLWVLITPGIWCPNEVWDGYNVANGKRPALDYLLNRCQQHPQMIRETKKRGNDALRLVSPGQSCVTEFLPYLGIQIKGLTAQNFVPRYMFHQKSREQIDKAVEKIRTSTFVKGSITDDKGKDVPPVKITATVDGVQGTVTSRASSFFNLVIPTPPREGHRRATVTVNAEGFKPYKQDWALIGQCNEWYTIELEHDANAGKAAVKVMATKGDYTGPPITGPLRNGEIIALRGVVNIPGQKDAKRDSKLRWQLLDTSGKQVGLYEREVPISKTGEVKSQVRFKLEDVKDGTYMATLTHRFNDTPDHSTAGFFKVQVRDGGAGKVAIAIKATRDTYTGPPVSGPLQDGEIVALQAALDIPARPGKPTKSTLDWQLYDATGNKVSQYHRSVPEAKTGKVDSRLRFLLQDIPPGNYVARLTHTFDDDPKSPTSASVPLAFGTGGPAGDKAKITIKANKEDFNGPKFDGKIEVGDYLALTATVDIPGDPNMPPSSYLTWQIFDASGAPLKQYFDQSEIYDVGRVTVRKKFLLLDMPPGDYTAALTHQFAQTPEQSSQAVVRMGLDRPIYIIDAWVADQKDGQKLQDDLGYGKAPFFYVTFELAEGVTPVKVTLRARDADTGKDLGLETFDYEKKEDRKVQRVGMMLQPFAVEKAGGVKFTAKLCQMKGDNFGPTISADAVAKIHKPTGRVTVSLPDEMTSGQMYRLSFDVPPDFQAPYKVDVEAGGMRFKPSSDPLRGTVKGFASDTSTHRTLKVTVTDARGFKAKGGAFTTIIPKEVAEARDAPPKPVAGYDGGSGGSGAVTLPDASGPPGDEEKGRKRIAMMVKYLEGLCPACTGGVLCDSAMNKIINHIRKQDPAVVGGLSLSQAKQVLHQLAVKGAQLYIQEVRNLGDISNIKYCVNRTFGGLEDEGILPGGTGDQVIASIEGGGGSGGSSGGGAPYVNVMSSLCADAPVCPPDNPNCSKGVFTSYSGKRPDLPHSTKISHGQSGAYWLHFYPNRRPAYVVTTYDRTVLWICGQGLVSGKTAKAFDRKVQKAWK
jgi:hypothetical protein